MDVISAGMHLMRSLREASRNLPSGQVFFMHHPSVFRTHIAGGEKWRHAEFIRHSVTSILEWHCNAPGLFAHWFGVDQRAFEMRHF